MVKLVRADSDSPIYLSVVIRCRNEAVSLRKVLQALFAQQFAFPWEVVIVDNMSEDDTATICEESGARHVVLPREEFTYGRAINVGFEAARGELVLLLSAHAVPLGSNFLSKCVEPFTDSAIVAARCLWVSIKLQTSEWFVPKVIQYANAEEQDMIESTSTEWSGQYPSATCAVYRRSAWARLKFDETIEAAEDKLWASQALRQGGKIYCCAEAFYMYDRVRSNIETIRKKRREKLGMYRITGKPPMSRATFASQTLRDFLNIPVAGIKHFGLQLVKNYGLLTVPTQARRKTKPGSLSEYDK